MLIALEARASSINADIDDIPGGDEVLRPAHCPGVRHHLGARTGVHVNQDWIRHTILHVGRKLDLDEG